MESPAPADPGALPLTGIRVLDLATVLGAPVAATLLGEFGADVVKIEEPTTGDVLRQFGPRDGGRPLLWLQEARNKKSITLDLRLPRGQEIFRRLAASADVVAENFRPGTLERWGLSYESLARENPGLVMLRVSGYGQTGPYRTKGAFDRIASAFAGLTYTSGFADGPPVRQSFALADYLAAAFGAYGVMLALWHRDRNGGGGQEIDLALYEGIFRSSEGMLTAYQRLGIVRERMGNQNPGVCPAGNYRAQDDAWVVINAGTDALWARLAVLMGSAALAGDARYAASSERVARADEVEGLVAAWVKALPAADVLRRLEAAGIPAERLYTVADIAADPHYRARNIVEVDDPRVGPVAMVGVIPRLSRTPGVIRWAGPDKGQHNAQVYGDRLGLGPDDLAALRAEGVI
jgi:crotonobetainyl-CoA:carnitine CoA-transferase CaiB-like acyl-CoA transferase